MTLYIKFLLALLFSPLAPVPKARHELEEGETLTSMKQTSCSCCFDRRRFLERPVHNICSVTAIYFSQIRLHCVTAGLDVLTSGSTLTGMKSQQKILNMLVHFFVFLFPKKHRLKLLKMMDSAKAPWYFSMRAASSIAVVNGSFE